MSKIHPSVEGLYAAASIRGHDAPAVVARALNVSAQRLQNWEERGISKEGALAAQKLYGADANALLEGRFEAMTNKKGSPSGDAASELQSLRDRVDSLSIAVAALISVTAQHRPVEAEKLVDAIQGNQSLDLSQYEQVQSWVAILSKARGAKPTARVRARSSS